MMRTIRLFGGSFGSDEMLVRCDLVQASSPIQFHNGDGEWSPTPYQAADTRQSLGHLVRIGKSIAADQLLVSEDEFDCESEEVDGNETETVTEVNVYESTGSWYYSAWCGAEHDHNGELDEAENGQWAIDLAKAKFPDAKVKLIESDSD
jgi:hypothetical protein